MAATVIGTPLDLTTAGQLAFTMASTAPPAGKTVFVFVTSRRGSISSAPTLAGTNGWNVTWTSLGTVETGGSTLSRLTVFRGIPSSSTAGTLTATHSTTHLQCQILALAIDSVDQTTAEGVVGTADVLNGSAGGALNVTFSPTVTAGNLAILAGVARGTPTSFTPDTSPVPDGSTSLLGGVNGFGLQWVVSAVSSLQGTLSPGVQWGNMGIEVALSAAVHSTLTANAGSYAVTGTSTPLLLGRRVSAGVGGYAVTGSPVALLRGRTLTAQAGSYATTGTPVGLRRGRTVGATAGAYGLAGTPTTLLVGRRLGASGGAYSVTGTPATLTYIPAGAAFVLTTAAGTYALTGIPATFRRQFAISPTPGAYTLTGTTALLTYTPVGVTLTLTALPGSYTVLGTPTGLRAGRRLASSVGAYSLAGTLAGLRRGRTVQVAAGAYSVAGTAAALRRTAVVFTASGVYTIVGSSAALVTIPTGQDYDEVLWGNVAMRQPASGSLAMRQPRGGTLTMRQPATEALTMRQPSAGTVAMRDED